MKIRAIHTFEYGVLGTQSLNFKDDWSGDTASRILLSGSNGCGKSTLLSGVAMLWESFGYWLQYRKFIPHLPFKTGAIALVLEQLPLDAPDIILFVTATEVTTGVNVNPFHLQRYKMLRKKYRAHKIIGQFGSSSFGNGARLLLPKDAKWFDDLTNARQKMLVSPEPSHTPNILFLDAEERRWVTPKKGVGEIRSESLELRWLSRYKATNNWDGQVESALLNMKVASEERFNKLVNDMNRFLNGKKILKKVNIGENRLNVQLDNDVIHSIDQLSAGERQVLILLYMVDRWLEKGGIALVDEPDLFLHPSLISTFLSQLEKMVAERDGQLIITSHIPEVWERYENLGKRVTLGADE